MKLVSFMSYICTKCTKRDARAKFSFVNINILFFAVLLAVAVVVVIRNSANMVK